MNRIRYRLLAAVATGLLCWLPLTAAAYEDAGNGALDQLFNQALEAEGQEYVSVRDQLLSDPGAVEFLEPMTLSTNLHSRVISRAMLGWLEERELNEERFEFVFYNIEKRNISHSGLSAIMSNYSNLDLSDTVLGSDTSVPFLLELMLKGPTSSVKKNR
ncbi:MAG: hypothetical protein JXR40_12510 [Pontiellaceae bacterium]|nr:hypothetical protein [Pontiellaceae bacterium]